MTMLDSSRAKSFLAKKANVGVRVSKMTIWGITAQLCIQIMKCSYS